MSNKFIEKLAIDLVISCEGNVSRSQRIENALKALTSYRDEILKVIGKMSDIPRTITEDNPQYDLGFNMGDRVARTEIINKIQSLLQEALKDKGNCPECQFEPKNGHSFECSQYVEK